MLLLLLSHFSRRSWLEQSSIPPTQLVVLPSLYLYLQIFSSSLIFSHQLLWCVVFSPSVVSDSLRPHNCSPPGSSVHGILQARILEWVAIPFSRGSSQPRDRTWVACIAGRFFTGWATREVSKPLKHFSSLSHVWLGAEGVTLYIAVILLCAWEEDLPTPPSWPLLGIANHPSSLNLSCVGFCNILLCSGNSSIVSDPHLIYLIGSSVQITIGIYAHYACDLSHFSCIWLFATLGTVAHQGFLSMGSSRQEYWNRLPFPSSRDRPNPEIEPASLSPALRVGSLPLVPPEKHICSWNKSINIEVYKEKVNYNIFCI